MKQILKLKIKDKEIKIERNEIPHIGDVLSLNNKIKKVDYIFNNYNMLGPLIDNINKAKKKGTKSYKSGLKRLFMMYYIGLQITKYKKSKENIGTYPRYTYYINTKLSTFSITDVRSHLHYYIYLGANYTTNIEMVYDNTMRYKIKVHDFINVLERKIEGYKFIEGILKDATRFSEKLYNKLKIDKL